jgi:adenine-specific DNA-methyltransferase
MHAKYSGRLELTWTNKDKRLLAHDDISYEWVSPTDYRVSEVRLLRDAGTVGVTEADERRAADNLVIQGDALHALTSLVSLPEFASEYAGKVKLVYIDPPFNTGGAFKQYDDNLEHSVWLTMMRDRLLQIRDVLSPDGTVWVHVDDVEVHRLRVVLDEVFGSDRFLANVIWEKTDSPRMDAEYFSARHDHILVYAKDRPVINHLDAEDPGHYKKVTEEGRRYYLNPLRARGGQGSTREARPTLHFPMIAPDGSEVYPTLPDGGEGAWRWSRERVHRDAEHIEWVKGRNGWNPYYRIYEPEHRTRPPETIWPHTEVGSTRTSNREIKLLLDGKAFATPKPERLMKRIIHVGSNPGDIVLDCFAGSGTTAAVAHKMGRRWVAAEWSDGTLRDFLIPRLTRVADGNDPGGVTDALGWEGGGGFRILDLAPSMFEADEGMVFLAEWATDSALGEATAAQLRFEYEPLSPFCGRKGRQRLAVLDGIATPEILDILVSSLGEGEKLVLCATAIAPDAREHLKTVSSGSRLRKIPASILAEYRVAYRVQRRRELNLEAGDAEAIEQIPEPATG